MRWLQSLHASGGDCSSCVCTCHYIGIVPMQHNQGRVTMQPDEYACTPLSVLSLQLFLFCYCSFFFCYSSKFDMLCGVSGSEHLRQQCHRGTSADMGQPWCPACPCGTGARPQLYHRSVSNHLSPHPVNTAQISDSCYVFGIPLQFQTAHTFFP